METQAANANMPLRVALVGDFPAGEDGVPEGGVQSVTHSLAHALARRVDVECHVVCATHRSTADYRTVGRLHVHYVKRLPLPKLVTCKLHDVPALASVIRDIRPDVVHGQGVDRHGLAALRSGYPTVITPHGVVFVESRALKRHRFDLLGGAKVRILTGWEREVFARAKDMIMISRYLPRIYGPMCQASSTFIDNPINPGYFSLTRSPVPGRLLFAGTVVPRKCVQDLIRAVHHLRQHATDASDQSWKAKLELRIAGPLMHEPTEQLLRRTISELGLDQHVTLLGSVSEDQLMEEYAQAQILLLGSREETAPQVIAQAMACGLPAVASDVGGVSAMIQDGITGLLFPFGEAEKCGDQILSLLQNQSLLDGISLRIRVEGLQRFHPDSVAQKTVDVYRHAMSRTA
jgi:glycosyltransferase involved in cell wall biosynthesis